MSFLPLVLVFSTATGVVVSGGSVPLSFGLPGVVFNEDFSKDLDPNVWKLTGVKIVDTKQTTTVLPTPSTTSSTTSTTKGPEASSGTTMAATTPAANLTTKPKLTPGQENGLVLPKPKETGSSTPMAPPKVLVPIFDEKKPESTGMLKRKVELKPMTRYTFEFTARAVGYDLSVEKYFDPKTGMLDKPFFEVHLITDSKSSKDTIHLFDFDSYGLNFNKEGWTSIKYTMTIGEKDTAGNRTLMYEMRGEKDPQVRGTFLKQIKMSAEPIPKDNFKIRDAYYASTTTSTTSSTTSSTKTPTTGSTPAPPTKKPETTKPTSTAKPDSRIMASKGVEIFMIILVVVFAIALIGLSYRHYVINKKLREYRVSRASAAAPNYDNPMYGGDRMGR